LASAPAGKLLLFEKVFDKDFHASIFDHLWLIVIFLLMTYIIVELIVYYGNIDKTLKSQCYNMCRYIYKYIERHIGMDFVHNSRITIFKAMCLNTEKVYLKAICRYQTKEPYKKAKLTFRPGVGVAGSCFETQTLVLATLPEYDEKNPEEYYKESYDKYKMDRFMVEKLNSKSCLFLGIPIKFFNTEKTWGVLVLDSIKKDDQLNFGFARNVEAIIEHYKVFFTEGDK